MKNVSNTTFRIVMIALGFAMLTPLIFMGFAESKQKKEKTMSFQNEYVAKTTVDLIPVTENSDVDVAISNSEKIPGSEMMVVKIKRVHGGYLTALTTDTIMVGDRVLLKNLKTINSVGFWMTISVAEKMSVPSK